MDQTEQQHVKSSSTPQVGGGTLTSEANDSGGSVGGNESHSALGTAMWPSPSLSATSTSSTRSNTGLPSTIASQFDHIPTPLAMDSRRQSSESTTSGLTMATAAGTGGLAPTTSNGSNGMGTPQRSRSILNLTSSTLFGIYNSHTGYDANRVDEATTPWGTGAQTPARNPSIDGPRPTLMPSRADFEAKRLRERQRDRRGVVRDGSYNSPNGRQIRGSRLRPLNKQQIGARIGVAGIAGRAGALFAIGVAYGVLITHLHDTQGIAPVRMDAIRRGKGYLAFWGVLGVLLGTLLPWLDVLWDKSTVEGDGEEDSNEVDGSTGVPKDNVHGGSQFASNIRQSLGADWAPVVRSIGAFLGIAFGIRKLPWQSTLQLSLTLALVNPVIWYLIDRSKAGFLLSATVGICGATILFNVNPAVAAPPAAGYGRAGGNSSVLNESLPLAGLMGNMVSYESIGAATWISSVLFCSCVCFGNIGRRLAWQRRTGGTADALS